MVNAPLGGSWQQLDIPYALEDTEPPDVETVDWACAVFRAAGLKAF